MQMQKNKKYLGYLPKTW